MLWEPRGSLNSDCELASNRDLFIDIGFFRAGIGAAPFLNCKGPFSLNFPFLGIKYDFPYLLRPFRGCISLLSFG